MANLWRLQLYGQENFVCIILSTSLMSLHTNLLFILLIFWSWSKILSEKNINRICFSVCLTHFILQTPLMHGYLLTGIFQRRFSWVVRRMVPYETLNSFQKVLIDLFRHFLHSRNKFRVPSTAITIIVECVYNESALTTNKIWKTNKLRMVYN